MLKPKIYIISGERSGDLHASNLVSAIKELSPNSNFRGMGGDLSSEAGVDICVDYSEVALMGFIEVVFGFPKVLKFLRIIKEDILSYSPDLILLVDYGGFNMKIAKFAKDLGIPVHYYIPPKVWAWNQKRALKLKEVTTAIYSILPFEPAFFKKFQMDVNYVGNPLLDEIKSFSGNNFFLQKNDLSFDPIVALLPGSRKQEVEKILAKMIHVSKEFVNIQFVVAAVRSLPDEVYDEPREAGIKIVFDQTYDLLSHAIAAVVTSGTATLETCIFRVPQIVVYETSAISYFIGKKLIRVDYISLVNLIANREVVKEFIQGNFSVENIKLELNRIFSNQVYKGQILQGYDEVLELLGTSSASEITAKEIVKALKK